MECDADVVRLCHCWEVERLFYAQLCLCIVVLGGLT